MFEDFLRRPLSCLQYFPRVVLSFGGRSSFMGFCLRCCSHQVERNGATIYTQSDILVTWLGGILIPKFLNTMRVEGFKWEKKIHGRKLAAPKTMKRRTKQKKTQKVKCLYLMGIYLARQLLGPIQGVQPQILWLIVRRYAISFRGPNCSF